ncbi:MAG: hypothetical protein R3C29_08510 [Dehalococcoidia bacterium]|nr:hypothetical protein [Dehalococcoidia bacterium]
MLTALAGGVHPITRTNPVPGSDPGDVGVAAGVEGFVAVATAVFPGVAVGFGVVAVAVGVRVAVAVAVAVAVGVRVAVAVGVDVEVAVGVGVAVAVGVDVLVGRLVAVAVGVDVGPTSSNWKVASALSMTKSPQTALTLMRTTSPGEPVTVNVPLSVPPTVEPEPVTRPGGTDVTFTPVWEHQ